MGCRCTERRHALAHAAKSLANGHAAAALPHARFIAVTTIEDMTKIMRPRTVPDLRKPTVVTPKPPKHPR